MLRGAQHDSSPFLQPAGGNRQSRSSLEAADLKEELLPGLRSAYRAVRIRFVIYPEHSATMPMVFKVSDATLPQLTTGWSNPSSGYKFLTLNGVRAVEGDARGGKGNDVRKVVEVKS